MMTQFEVCNNMAYASQMQFEVLRRALWAQQAQPNIVFVWKFWEKVAQNPKMSAYLHHGVKATRFVNTVGTQYIAPRPKWPVTLFAHKDNLGSQSAKR